MAHESFASFYAEPNGGEAERCLYATRQMRRKARKRREAAQ